MNAEINEKLRDLLLINSIIALEALQITENTSKIARNSNEIPPQCVEAHGKLRSQIINILNKYYNEENFKALSDHALGH